MEPCCPQFSSLFESASDKEARLLINQLNLYPIQIWWHRSRRFNVRNVGVDCDKSHCEWDQDDVSLFPKSWSDDYDTKNAENISNEVKKAVMVDERDNVGTSLIEATSNTARVHATTWEEQREIQNPLRDEDGNCIKHPSVKLAERRTNGKLRPRLSMLFTKNLRNRSSKDDDCKETEWSLLLKQCPECEKESFDDSNTVKQNRESFCQLRIVSHERFPATITVVQSHPHLPEGSYAFQIRTDPLPVDQTEQTPQNFHSSFDRNDETCWEWTTPEGAIDFLKPCNSDRIELECTNNEMVSQALKYQIIERIIPFSSVDNVARGGGAWDVLRQSFNHDGLGSLCDLKIHGFSDRLLRFDVVYCGDLTQRNSVDSVPKLRYSFYGVDFFRSSISRTVKNNDPSTATKRISSKQEQTNFDSQTIELVMSTLNDLVMWDRDRRKGGVKEWVNHFYTWAEEYSSLGLPNACKEFIPVTKKRENG